MLINEVSKKTGLTKKAIDYNTIKGLLKPEVLENGYRDYSESDLEILGRISVLRKLSLGLDDIQLILSDNRRDILSDIVEKRDLEIRRDLSKKELLVKLSRSLDYETAEAELKALERGYSIRERLLEAFPGYFGKIIMLNFSSYLDVIITTAEQERAYEKIIEFLDNCPNLELPEDLKDYLEKTATGVTEDMIMETIENKEKAVANPSEFFEDNAEIAELWMEYKNSDEYKNSPMYKITEYLTEFYLRAGFVDEFIPTLRELSPEYNKYYEMLMKANELYLEKYGDGVKQ